MSGSRRVQITKQLLKTALLTALREKPMEKITIKNLCKMADINRSTFYNHYSCPGDLLSEIERDLIDHFPKFDSLEKGNIRSVLNDFLRYVRLNSESVYVMLNMRETALFRERLGTIVLSQYKEVLPKETGVNTEIMNIYCIGGVISLIRIWIENDFPWSEEELTDAILRLTYR